MFAMDDLEAIKRVKYRYFRFFDTANVEDNESWYQEFKFSGQTGSFDWVAGVSYYSEDATQSSDTHAYTDSIDTLLLNLGLAGTPDGTLFVSDDIFVRRLDTKGQVTTRLF